MQTETAKKDDDTLKLIGTAILGVIVLIVLLVSWLNPAPSKPAGPMCDYCRVGQADAKPFPCRQCGKVHTSCGKESGLRAFDARKDKEGVAIGRSIKVCPEGAVSR